MQFAALYLGFTAFLLTDERVLAVRNESTVSVRGLFAEIHGAEKRIPPVAPRGSVVVRVRTNTERPWEIFRVRDGQRERLGACGRIDAGRPGWSTLHLVSPSAGPARDCVLAMQPNEWKAAQQ
jgi:hypothetical protein